MPRHANSSKSVAIRKHATVASTVSPPHSFGQTMKEAVAFGVGTSVGRHLTDKVVGMFSSPAKVAGCEAYEECCEKIDRNNCDKIFTKCAPKNIE